ncbi:MAG TPA: M23 family metallopeptidase [Bacteroidales bacterium]|nr:M23 family metallopeptidase [Bacteroidales bacterium]
MAKIKRKITKYHFDPKSLSFQRVKTTFKERILKFLYIIAAGTVFSIIVIILAFNFIDSPKEKKLRRELTQYELQFKLLNDRIEKLNSVLADIQNRDDNIYRVIFEAEPIPSEVRNAGIGGAEKYANLEGYDNSKLIIETTSKIDKLSRQLYVQSKSLDEILEMAKNKSKMLASIPAIQPISKNKSQLVSGFGYRIHPIYKTMLLHTGLDFAAKPGTPVYATGDGKVIKPDNDQTGYGIVVIIDHGYGYQSLYAHLSKSIVKPGQQVKRGQLIGYVGNTGLSAGPHLHYEIIKNNKKINPIHYFYNDLTPEEYQKLLQEASKVNQSLS